MNFWFLIFLFSFSLVSLPSSARFIVNFLKMRSTIALAVVAATAVAVSAQNCNPTYNVAGSGECFTNCNIVCIFFLLDLYQWLQMNSFIKNL